MSCGTGVEDPRGGPLERHLVQSGDEAGLIPAALLLRRWSGGRSAGELGGGERGVGLGRREGVEDPWATRCWWTPRLLMHPGCPGRVAVPRGRRQCRGPV